MAEIILGDHIKKDFYQEKMKRLVWSDIESAFLAGSAQNLKIFPKASFAILAGPIMSMCMKCRNLVC